MKGIFQPCLCGLLLSLTGLGCSSEDDWTKNLPETVTASGTVTLDGEPVSGANVVFAPVAPGEHAASALTDSSGVFEMKAFPSKDGAVPGSYQVSVTKTVQVDGTMKKVDYGEDAAHAEETAEAATGWENVLPRTYANPMTSGLQAEVPADGTSDLKVELSSRS